MYVRYHIIFELWSGDFLLFCCVIGSSRFFISCFHLVDVFIKYVSKSRPRPFGNGDGGTKVSLYLYQKIRIFQYLLVHRIRKGLISRPISQHLKRKILLTYLWYSHVDASVILTDIKIKILVFNFHVTAFGKFSAETTILRTKFFQ